MSTVDQGQGVAEAVAEHGEYSLTVLVDDPMAGAGRTVPEDPMLQVGEPEDQLVADAEQYTHGDQQRLRDNDDENLKSSWEKWEKIHDTKNIGD